MLHACVQKFDVTGTVENFLGTKQGLSWNSDHITKIVENTWSTMKTTYSLLEYMVCRNINEVLLHA